jgi:selT/selW/selH-like putative selenoprotein
VSLAESIEREAGTQSELVRGDNGIFDVEVDGRRIYSKHQTGRVPQHEEILAQLRGG